jgi:hypothetical protein
MGARRVHRVIAGAPWQYLRHRRSAAAATVRTNPEGTERVTQAEAVHEQVEHAAKNTCQEPWGMVGMRVIRYHYGMNESSVLLCNKLNTLIEFDQLFACE